MTISCTNQIVTSLYCKPTDSHNYLLYSSEHPRHLLRGIPYSQFLRVSRICSNILDFRSSALMLSSHFIRRGYPKLLIINALCKAEAQDRETLITKNLPGTKKPMRTDKDDRFYLIVTHNPNNPPIRQILENNWPLLEKSKTTRIISNSEIIFGTRRNKNLSDQLVRASTKTVESPCDNRIRNPCHRPTKCRYCPLINRSGHINSKENGKQFNVKKHVNCQSSNLIYLITCRHCQSQYVGQTKNRLLTRFQGHFNDIIHDRDTTVARHFNRCPPDNPSMSSGLSISILSFINSHPESREARQRRDTEERRWMHQLSTITPNGLNLMD